MTALTKQTLRDIEIATTSSQAATELKNLADLATTLNTTAVKQVAGATGVKMLAGEIALDGSGATTVATGLTTITSAVLTLKKATSPGIDPITLTYDTSGGTLSIYPWEATGTGDVTLIASNATTPVGYLVFGT